jgi:hypothetical protein
LSGKRLSMRVDLLPTVVHTPVVIDVGESEDLRVVETFYCNATGADRLMYGRGEEAVLHAVLVAHLTRMRHADYSWEPIWEDSDIQAVKG